MKYIRFGMSQDIVWVIDEDMTKKITCALEVRGYKNVTDALEPLRDGKDPLSVWEETRYLDGADRPDTVYMITLGPSSGPAKHPFAASTSEKVANMVIDALTMTGFGSAYAVQEIGQPE